MVGEKEPLRGFDVAVSTRRNRLVLGERLRFVLMPDQVGES
jgi:hypothetical protein